MALYYPVAPVANYHRQLKLSHQNLLADLVYNRRSKVAPPSFLTVRCDQKVESVKAASVAAPAATEVVLVDGLEPVIMTPPKDLRRDDFPSNFKFGASTSALQTEGSGTDGGRGKSTWDFMIQASQERESSDERKNIRRKKPEKIGEGGKVWN